MQAAVSSLSAVSTIRASTGWEPERVNRSNSACPGPAPDGVPPPHPTAVATRATTGTAARILAVPRRPAHGDRSRPMSVPLPSGTPVLRSRLPPSVPIRPLRPSPAPPRRAPGPGPVGGKPTGPGPDHGGQQLQLLEEIALFMVELNEVCPEPRPRVSRDPA
ncbi:hypothetical protein GCM10027160_47980 [Streptomyces calidiresistens]